MAKSFLQQLKEKVQKKVGIGTKFLPYEQDGKRYNLYDMPDGFVIEDSIDISSRGLTELPDLSKVTVTGDFNCSNNRLTSLKGAPQKVGGKFDCSCNQLTTLEGTPEKVGGGFLCEQNALTTLKGAPREVGGCFCCYHNQLTTLEGAPQKVGEEFSCRFNYLTSLEGAPQEVGDDFNCKDNELTSLKGIPPKIGGSFWGNDNDLASLEGAVTEIEGDFWCQNNRLTELKASSVKIGGDFICDSEELESFLGLPVMNEHAKIYCSNKICAKYGFPSKGADFGIEYGDLTDSTEYNKELALHRISDKKRDGERDKNEADMLEKRRAGFAAFKKKLAEEREKE